MKSAGQVAYRLRLAKGFLKEAHRSRDFNRLLSNEKRGENMLSTRLTKSSQWLIITTLFVLGMALLVPGNALAQRSDPENIPPPETVTIAGTIQSQLGCPGDWNTECEETMLVYDPDDDLWLATFELAAGNYEYKAALNGSWDDNYGLNAEYYGANIPLEVPADGPVTFWYDHKTRWVSDNVNSLLANVPGSFQDEIGCPGEWAPDCLRSLLTDPDGDGVYSFITADIPPGDYEAKVAVNQSWDVNFGADGAQDGANIPFTAEDGLAVAFLFDSDSNMLTIQSVEPGSAPAVVAAGGGMPAPAVSPPDLVVIPGTLQDEAGCPGEWQPECESTALILDEATGVWSNTFSLPAGDYEYKVALNGSWDVNFGLNAQPGGPNIPLSLAEDSDVTFFFSTQTGWVTDDVNSAIVTAIGDFQAALGCPEAGAADCLGAWLQDPDGDGTFLFQTDAIPAGDYAAQVAVGRTLDEVYGAEGAAGGEPIPFTVAADGELVNFIWDSESKALAIRVGAAAGPAGNINEPRAHWVSADTIAWDIEPGEGDTYRFHYTRTGGTLDQTLDDIAGGDVLALTLNPDGLSAEVLAKFPHLSGFQAFTIAPEDLRAVRVALKGQVAVSALDSTGVMVDATGLQIPGVLDDIYAYDGPLGVTYENGVPTLRVWAPTAQLVRLALYDDSDPATRPEFVTMRADPDTGVWSITGEPDWDRKFYEYEVKVFAPAAGEVVTNLVTDPYSFSLSLNSDRSQIVNLDDAELKPEGWDASARPPLAAPEDAVIYELHVRDFSIFDETVPEELRGTYKAFTVDSDGTRHLMALAEAGVNHLHLLPHFDITTINENAAERVEPDVDELSALPPDSDQQQSLIGEVRDQDGFNWGYDPYHYTVPEGSYSTDPDGVTRILEFREMVQALNAMGLRVVSDVVYNHTSSSGQAANAVLDRIVPGYYHRLDDSGRVQTSTCCQNTATEHDMMRKLMVDSVVTWVTQYGIDAFRFDLMGHHMKDDMLAVRAAVDAIDPSIYIYGEGWNFGEVANDQRGVNATQTNLAGTGIGTFNDRLRDAARGGSPFGGQQEQGFVNGLYYDPNETDQGPDGEQLARLLNFADLIRVGLAGNLAGYTFTDATGETITGADVDYNGSPAGYTADPQENIVYVSKHDNETLFDAVQYKAPAAADMATRVRMQNMGNSIVMFSQGVPFFQAADDLLRSKSLDRNSYNSGDWFNAIDWSGQTTNWGRGLPPASDNQNMWSVMQPLLGDPDLVPQPEHIAAAAAHFREIAQIRAGSPLFRLQTAEDVQARLKFHNTGPQQIPGVIVMSLSDLEGENLDPNYGLIVTLFNANDEELTFTEEALNGLALELHPVLANSADELVRTATFDAATAMFTVPGRTTAVFVLPESAPAATEEEAVAQPEPTAEPAPQPTAEVGAVAESSGDQTRGEAAEVPAETAQPRPIYGESATTALAMLLGILGVGGLVGFIAWRRERQRPE
jgi:pullulanase-type alpha-1,6-glucosidase